MNTVEYGPLIEETMLSAGLDYYKPTMSQFIHEVEPDVEITFTFKNRGEQRLLDYIDIGDISDRLERIRNRGFQPEELEFFTRLTSAAGERMFSDDYINHLADSQLPEVNVTVVDDDLAISCTGEWAMTTFWETVIMSEVNEAYFENYVRANNIDLLELYEEGDRRLSEKIAFLQEHPDLKVAEFGTRRRFSLRWQRHVIQRLAQECPNNLIGTSNVALAQTLGLKAIGTFAHELPMGYAGLADARDQDIRASHGQMLDDWYDFYGDELAIALSDTFGSEFFFEDFTPQRSANYKGTRHDSGDPIVYGQKAVTHYQDVGIDPETKMVLFSDSLNVPKAGCLEETLHDQTNTAAGIGINFTNDLGLEPLNIVMKATHVRLPDGKEADLVKLSDDAGKHTGPLEKVKEYQKIFEPKGGSK